MLGDDRKKGGYKRGLKQKGWEERQMAEESSGRGVEMKSRFNEGGVKVGPVTDWCHYELLELTALNDTGFAPVFPSLIVLPRWSRSRSFGLLICSTQTIPTLRPVESLKVIDLMLSISDA